MRQHLVKSGITVHAIAGTHVVLLGFDLSTKRRKGCLGFAIHRIDHTENEAYWLSGLKTFESVKPDLAPSEQVSSREHPFQSFQWSDYSAKPDHTYTYLVIPMYGTPDKLDEGPQVEVTVKTESEIGAKHTVYFNRGAVASQEYARRFQDRMPSEIGEAAYRWLSRGLEEAMIDFIGRAKGKSYGLYGAIYEFQWPDVLEALRAARNSGATVKIVYDGIKGKTKPRAKNIKAIQTAKLTRQTQARTIGTIMHNKFFVLTKNKKPIAVWTGSTNVTENGIFGHSNCGHLVEDPDTAATYWGYWNRLAKKDPQPQLEEQRTWVDDENEDPKPASHPRRGTTAYFSPRNSLALLQWYAALADSAEKGLFMTFAFGMHKDFLAVYGKRDHVLRFALMEKEGNGKQLKQGKKDIARVRKLPNICVAIGNSIQTNEFDHWLVEEVTSVKSTVNVRWIHTKYMLVDPLGDDPIVVTGSANFSKASTDTNEENMIVIRGDKRVADIYLGEYMRLFSHYAFREAIAKFRGKADDWRPNYLLPNDSWTKDYFKASHPRSSRREYFAATPA